MSGYDTISDAEKVKIASDFITNAPPGEFNEVFNDVRVILENDNLLREGGANAFAKYNKDAFIPVDVSGASKKALVTHHAEIDGNTYFDPRSGQKFEFDHLRKEASGASPYVGPDGGSEGARKQVEAAVDAYVAKYFPAGVSSTYAKNGEIIICIEDHKYSPRNFWNGRWTSEYKVSANGGALTGTIKAVVHFYEAGNVQLHGNKDVSAQASGSDLGAAVVDAIHKAETSYQNALNESYMQMSSTTFKALRRQLPVTRSLLDWTKILNYKIGSELGGK
jgi:capping protein alpha